MDNISKPWHEDDTFWETFGPEMFGTKRWDAAPVEIEQALALLRLAPQSAILDLCCGPGRHALELARRGFSVTGVDHTGTYLDEARRRAQDESLSLELVQEDMRRFRRPATFDAAINMFTAFGYFEDPADDRRVVQNLYTSLKSGGTFLLDIIGKENIAGRFRERDWSERDGMILLEERRVMHN